MKKYFEQLYSKSSKEFYKYLEKNLIDNKKNIYCYC